MSGIFDPENKMMQLGVKFADLLLVNAMTLLLSLPVITAGAAFSAMHYMVLRIYRDEQASVIREYWRAFRQNWKQGTRLLLIYLGIGAVLGCDIYLIAADLINWGQYFNLLVLAVTVIYLISLAWVFVLQSRYNYGIRDMVKYSLVLGFRNLPASVAMVILAAAPIAFFLVMAKAIPFVLLMGASLPAFLQAMLYSRILDRFEGVDPKDRYTR